MNKKEVQILPKIDLHCHLDGSLNLACVSKLIGRDVSLNELQVSEDCKNLAEYLEKFALPLAGLQTKESLQHGAYNFIKDVASENIKYVEVRFAPILSTEKGLNQEEVVESVLAGLANGEKTFGVQSNVIVSLMRHHDHKTNLNVVKLAKEFLGHGVCAIDLAGDEASFPMADFVDLFTYANSIGIPFTVHAGEQGSVKNVLDSVNCGAQRIGHGIALAGNKKAQDIIKSKKIGLELCPISNQQTKSVADISKYPIREFLDNNLLVTINTDNRMVSNTSIGKEISFIQENFGITDEEIKQLMLNAIEVSFATDAQKHLLVSKF